MLANDLAMQLFPGAVSFGTAGLTFRVVLEATALQTLNEIPMEALEEFSIEDESLKDLFPFSSG